MKKVKLLLIVIAVAMMLTTAFVFSACNNDTPLEPLEPGILFRRQHGFLGIMQYGGSVSLMAFNIGNQDIAFFEDYDNLSFAIDGITITEAKIRFVHALTHGNNPTNVEYFVLDIFFEMSIAATQLTHLKTNNGVFEIGSINLQQKYVTDTIISHGTNTLFLGDDGIYLYLLTLSDGNTKSFDIKELIFYHDNIYSYDLEDATFPINYIAGTRLELFIWLTFDMNRFDQFVLSPVLTIVLDGQEEYSFFIPFSPTMHGISMTYLDVREYVNDKKQ